MPAEITVRRLVPADAPAFRTLRLQALKDHPNAFGDDHAEAMARPDDYWRSALEKRMHFGGFDGERLVATAHYDRLPGRKLAHRAVIYGVFIAADCRGRGAGLALLAGLEDHARKAGILQLQLGVGSTNTAALRLYEKSGFKVCGSDPRALIVDGESIDETLMVKFLDRSDA